MPRTKVLVIQGILLKLVYYLAFLALNFAHLARCAAAILARAAAESLRVPPDFPATPLNASIALSNFARSAFNCDNIAPKSAILSAFFTGRSFTGHAPIIPCAVLAASVTW